MKHNLWWQHIIYALIIDYHSFLRCMQYCMQSTVCLENICCPGKSLHIHCPRKVSFCCSATCTSLVQFTLTWVLELTQLENIWTFTVGNHLDLGWIAGVCIQCLSRGIRDSEEEEVTHSCFQQHYQWEGFFVGKSTKGSPTEKKKKKDNLGIFLPFKASTVHISSS